MMQDVISRQAIDHRLWRRFDAAVTLVLFLAFSLAGIWALWGLETNLWRLVLLSLGLGGLLSLTWPCVAYYFYRRSPRALSYDVLGLKFEWRNPARLPPGIAYGDITRVEIDEDPRGRFVVQTKDDSEIRIPRGLGYGSTVVLGFLESWAEFLQAHGSRLVTQRVSRLGMQLIVALPWKDATVPPTSAFQPRWR